MWVFTFQAKVIFRLSVPLATLGCYFYGIFYFTNTLQQYVIWIVHVGVNLLKTLELFKVQERRTVMLGLSV